MLPIARTENIKETEEGNDLIVHVPELDEHFVLSPITAWVWRHADGQTRIADMVARLSQDLGISVDQEMVWSAIDCLADACLLDCRIVPPTGKRRGLMQRLSLRSGLTSATIQMLPKCTSANTIAPHATAEEEARKQREAAEERNTKFMEKQEKDTKAWEAERQKNQREIESKRSGS